MAAHRILVLHGRGPMPLASGRAYRRRLTRLFCRRRTRRTRQTSVWPTQCPHLLPVRSGNRSCVAALPYPRVTDEHHRGQQTILASCPRSRSVSGGRDNPGSKCHFCRDGFRPPFWKTHEIAADVPAAQSFLAAKCRLRCLFISNMSDDFLPNTFASFSSALIFRRSLASCRSFFLM